MKQSLIPNSLKMIPITVEKKYEKKKPLKERNRNISNPGYIKGLTIMKIFQGNKMRYIALIMSMESDIRMKEFFKMDMIGIIYMMSKILKISNYVTKFRI